jgi:deoxyribodipyrimidine photo-lyase
VPSVPEIRVRKLNDAPVSGSGDFVLYWMISSRRATCNFALQRAIDWSTKLNKPIVVLEALRAGHEWASDRLHRFVLEGMADNKAAFAGKPVRYYPYVEPSIGAGSGLVDELAARASVVVTDDFPCFFIPRMLKKTAARLPTQLEAVDSNGLLPMRAVNSVFPTAYAFRRFLQRELTPHLTELPEPDPFDGAKIPEPAPIDPSILEKWPEATDELLEASDKVLSDLPIDHSVGPAAFSGGSSAAQDALQTFLDEKLHRYHEDRSQPEADVASGLSPWLHFGHISASDVFAQLAMRENWNFDQLADNAKVGSYDAGRTRAGRATTRLFTRRVRGRADS